MRRNKTIIYICLHCDLLFVGTDRTKWHRVCDKNEVRPATEEEMS